LIYLLDTNAVSDWLSPKPDVIAEHIEHHLEDDARIVICQPVYYELRRGLLWRKAERKLKILREKILPLLEYVTLEEADWVQAAQFWADARQQGHQLADIDLLVVAISVRLKAIIVTRDADFDVLSITREDWSTT
jgi:predicted nucleic acid-binding protein